MTLDLAGHRLRYGAIALALVVAVVVAFVVITPSDDSATPKSAPTPDRPTPVEVTFDGRAYRSKVKRVPAGWIKVTFRNETTETRELTLARLGAGKTMADLDESLTDPRAIESLAGAYVFQGGATMVPPRASVSFRTEVFPGQLLLGSVPELAAGTGSPASLEVEEGDPPLVDPATTATVRLDPFSHALLGDIKKAGPQVLSTVGEGPATHEVRLYRVQDGIAPTTAYRRVPAMKDAPDEATEFVRPELGVAPMDPGFVNLREISLMPGDYVMTCFLIDAQTGKTYNELGMSTPFQVS